MHPSRDPITFRWWLLLAVVVVMTAGLAVGWALATQSQSAAEAKVEPALMDATRAQDEEATARECADFADDKTREEFVRYGGPAKGCDMGYASLNTSRQLVATAKVNADQADVNAEIVQRNVTRAIGVVDRWIFGIGLVATLGVAALVIAPRGSMRPPQDEPADEDPAAEPEVS